MEQWLKTLNRAKLEAGAWSTVWVGVTRIPLSAEDLKVVQANIEELMNNKFDDQLNYNVWKNNCADFVINALDDTDYDMDTTGIFPDTPDDVNYQIQKKANDLHGQKMCHVKSFMDTLGNPWYDPDIKRKNGSKTALTNNILLSLQKFVSDGDDTKWLLPSIPSAVKGIMWL